MWDATKVAVSLLGIDMAVCILEEQSPFFFINQAQLMIGALLKQDGQT